MTVLDAYAVLALLRDEMAADEVREVLRNGGALTAVGVAEVIDQLVRVFGVEEEEAILDLAELGLDRAFVVTVDIGADAGRLRAQHYHRTRRPVSMADCVAAAVARQSGRPLATSDGYLLELCHEDGIPALPLRRSDGSRWQAEEQP